MRKLRHFLISLLLLKIFTSVLRAHLSCCECASFSFGSVGGMWDLIVSVPDNCLLFCFKYFLLQKAYEDSGATLNISCNQILMEIVVLL